MRQVSAVGAVSPRAYTPVCAAGSSSGGMRRWYGGWAAHAREQVSVVLWDSGRVGGLAACMFLCGEHACVAAAAAAAAGWGSGRAAALAAAGGPCGSPWA